MDPVLLVALFIWSGALSKMVPIGGGISVVLACLLVLTSVAARALRPGRILHALSYYAPLLLLAAISGVWAEDPVNWVGKLFSFSLMLVTAAAYARHRPDALNVLVRTLMVYGIVHSGLSLLLIYSGTSFGRASPTHLVGILSHKTALTNMSAFTAVAAAWCLIGDKGPFRALSILSLILSAWILWIGGGGQATLGAAIAVLIMLTRRYVSSHLAIAGYVFVGIVAALLPFIDQLADLVSAFTGKDANLTGRLAFWMYGRGLIDQQALLGHGFSNIGYTESWSTFQLSSLYNDYGAVVVAPNMHNQWIELTYMLGYPGLITGFTLIVALPVRYFSKTSAASIQSIGLCTLQLILSAFNSNLLLNAPEPFIFFCAMISIRFFKSDTAVQTGTRKRRPALRAAVGMA